MYRVLWSAIVSLRINTVRKRVDRTVHSNTSSSLDIHSSVKNSMLPKNVDYYEPIDDNLMVVCISAMLKVPDGTFSWKWFKSLAQRSDLNLVGSTWSPK